MSKRKVTVRYRRQVTAPKHLAGDVGNTRRILPVEARKLAAGGYVTLEKASSKTSQGRNEQPQSPAGDGAADADAPPPRRKKAVKKASQRRDASQ